MQVKETGFILAATGRRGRIQRPESCQGGLALNFYGKARLGPGRVTYSVSVRNRGRFRQLAEREMCISVSSWFHGTTLIPAKHS